MHGNINVEIAVERNQFADWKALDPQLVMWIISTHSDVPINNRLYRRQEMQRQVQSFTYPFKKPVLVHHDDHDDQVGRVVEAYYVGSEMWDTKIKELTGKYQPLPLGQTGQIVLKQVITDNEAVNKILDGIYQTVSVGFDADDLKCSICGKSMLYRDEEGGCQHVAGEEYDGNVQYGVPVNITYREVSFVNVPADAHAQVISIMQVEKTEARKLINPDITDENENKEFVNSEQSNKSAMVDDVQVQNVDKEVAKMETVDMKAYEELKQASDELRSKLEDAEQKYNALLEEHKKLKDEYSTLLGHVHKELLEKVAGLRAILLGIESEDEVNAIKESYKDMGIEQLKLLETEFTTLVDKMLSRISNDTKAESKQEAVQVEEKKDEQTAAEKQTEQVEVTKDSSPVKMTDSKPDILSILGIRK